jgi:DNA-binding IclR family transcriptional regulator
MRPATEAYFVTRTVRALEALATRPLTSTELADLIGVHPRTARRLLVRLAHENYVTRLPGSRWRYSLTMQVPRLGARALINAGAAGDQSTSSPMR